MRSLYVRIIEEMQERLGELDHRSKEREKTTRMTFWEDGYRAGLEAAIMELQSINRTRAI